MRGQETSPETFRAFRAFKEGERSWTEVVELGENDLPDGDLTVRVHYSSLNYKDALSARGRPGVTRHYPHTPGIDAAGVVIESSDPALPAGSEVIVTSYELGVDLPGGFGERIRVPAAWAVPLPNGLTLREAMILGTAGLTAGLALDALERNGVVPGDGPLVVTGASGGVGSLAVALLAGRGHEVVASSGTREAHELLLRLGASRVLDRGELGESNERPLLKSTYAGGIDTVGGATLVNLLKSLRYRGAVAACGLVQSPDLRMNVFPFILRGNSLLGIDSANCQMPMRREVWTRLAGEWKPAHLEELTREIGLGELDDAVDAILAGRTIGRVLVRHRDAVD
ncbi:MAG TPA: YhdH/YhfP family quinone oxidoreductase [Trueperaceae bacterium]